MPGALLWRAVHSEELWTAGEMRPGGEELAGEGAEDNPVCRRPSRCIM